MPGTHALNEAAADAGRAPDRELALEVLRKFGRTDVVAARYAPPGFNVIEPEHGPWFVRLSVACVVVQWAITLPQVFTPAMTIGEWWMGWGGRCLLVDRPAHGLVRRRRLGAAPYPGRRA